VTAAAAEQGTGDDGQYARMRREFERLMLRKIKGAEYLLKAGYDVFMVD
jgi:hypothetical protein